MHIIVAGSARSGKTTLSLMLKNRGYVHYKMDSIKRGICEAYNLQYDNWDEVSVIMATIINRIIKDQTTDTNYLKEDYLFDIPFLYPKDLDLIDINNTLVIFLGYSKLSIEENFNNIRKYDKDNYWTNNINDETLKKMCQENIEFSKYLESECNKYNIPYFDTSYNREEILKKIIIFIREKELEHLLNKQNRIEEDNQQVNVLTEKIKKLTR